MDVSGFIVDDLSVHFILNEEMFVFVMFWFSFPLKRFSFAADITKATLAIW